MSKLPGRLKRKLRRTIGKFRRALEARGVSGTVRLAAVSLADRLSRLANHSVIPIADPFDQEFGVETSRKVLLANLEVSSNYYGYGIEYSPVSLRAFHEAIRTLNIDHSRFRFIDLGSGKGRALLLAASLPFREIIGVEFSADLHKAALENIQRYSGPRNCREIFSFHLDAVEFSFPNDPLVVHLYHPFVGKTMYRVLANIEHSVRTKPRDFFILYLNPVMARDFSNCGVMHEIVTAPEYRVYRACSELQRTAAQT